MEPEHASAKSMEADAYPSFVQAERVFNDVRSTVHSVRKPITVRLSIGDDGHYSGVCTFTGRNATEDGLSMKFVLEALHATDPCPWRPHTGAPQPRPPTSGQDSGQPRLLA
jgi:hypothetical protein